MFLLVTLRFLSIPSHVFYCVFVIIIIFLSQCSLLQCDIKAFNKRQYLTVCTNLVKASISVYVFKYHQCKDFIFFSSF